MRKDGLFYRDSIKQCEREINMLRMATKMEKVVWWFLRNKDICFFYQYPFGKYCLDFYLPKKNICLEIDGISHFSDDRKEKDRLRDKSILQSSGIKTYRLSDISLKSLENFYSKYAV